MNLERRDSSGGVEAGRDVPLLGFYAEAVARGEVTLISVGPQCATAAILQKLGLRQAAFPFDWVFSSLAMVCHCLEDDFRTFLDPAEHEPVPLHLRKKPKINRAHHRFYRTMGVELVFNHHEMPASLPHFQRAVERFRTAANPVFLYVYRKHPPSPEVLELARSRLRGPLLVVQVIPAEVIGFHQESDRWIFRSRGGVTPLGLCDASDEVAFAAWLTSRLPSLPAPARDRSL